MDAITALMSRMSIRSYKPEQVAEADLDAIIRAAQQAPSAGVVHFSVVQDHAIIEEISEAGRQMMLNGSNEFHRQRASLEGYTPLYHAPTYIAISGPEGAVFNAVNAALAAENIMIAATALGYGSCYLAGITPVFTGADAKYRELIGIPKNYTYICGVIIGKVDDVNAFSPNPRPEKNRTNVNFIK